MPNNCNYLIHNLFTHLCSGLLNVPHFQELHTPPRPGWHPSEGAAQHQVSLFKCAEYTAQQQGRMEIRESTCVMFTLKPQDYLNSLNKFKNQNQSLNKKALFP